MHPKQVLSRIRKRQGRCYELAAKAILDSGDEWVLIHGEANGPGGRSDHAWLQSGDMVYDPVADREIPLAVYLTKYGGNEHRRYTKMQAAKMVSDCSVWGPWTLDEERRILGTPTA